MSFGKKAGDVKQIKRDAKSGKGNPNLRFIPKSGEGEFEVRFLNETDEWIVYHDVWDNGMRTSWPNPENADMDGYSTGDEPQRRISKKYLANVLIVNADEPDDRKRVVVVQLPLSVVNALTARIEKYGTVLDRTYTIYRTGEGKDTEYHVDPEPASSFNSAPYLDDCHDLEEILQGQWNRVWGEGSDEEPEPAPRRKPKMRNTAPQKAPESDPEDELDDDAFKPAEEATEADSEYYDMDELEAMSIGQLRALAEEYAVDVEGLNKAGIVNALVNE